MTLSGSASTVKDQGNVHFKAGRLEEAAKLYGKAEKLEPKNAIYPSNLSAAYYELGDYAQAYHAICRSAKNMLISEPSPALAIKLVTRLSKTLSCGVQSGSITLKDLDDNLSTINELRVIAETSASTSNSNASPEASSAWDEWKCVAQDFERVKNGAQDARSRLAALPFGRKFVDTGLEYYTVGQDPPMSIVHDWGPQDRNNPLELGKLSEARLSSLALLWGGVGDGRHVLSSIIGLHQAFTKLNAKKRKALKVHLTLNDLHPRALARDLCLLFLIEDLILMRSQEENKLKEAEIKATILYTWTGFIMPAYCQTRFKKIVKALLKRLQESPPNLPAWIYITQETIPGIIDALKYWDTKISQKNTKDMLRHLARTARTPAEHSQFLNSPGMASNFLDTYHKRQEEKREQLKNFVDVGLSEEQVIDMASKFMPRPIPRDPQRRKKWLADGRAAVVNLLLEDKGDGQTKAQRNEFILEEGWYELTQCFVPPAILRSRHDGFDELWGIFTEEEKGETRTSDGLDDKVRNHIETTWKPNPSLFDPSQEPNRSIIAMGYPDNNRNPFHMVSLIEPFNERMRLVKGRNMNARINQDCPAYSVISVFFDAVVDALIALKGRILLELIQDDISAALVKMRIGLDVSRPAHFPRKYSRIWLSNVPDSTHGPMNTAVYIMSNLECESYAALAFNCMFNSGVWQNGDHYVHNYTLLSVKDYARFFGCRVLTMDPAWGNMEFAPEPLPRPLSTLPSREELTTWLTRVLLATIFPPAFANPMQQMLRVRYPSNLVAFITLFLRLHEIGYPSHWLSEYLQTILSDSLVTDIAPYAGDPPIPLSELGRRGPTRRRMNLDPWRVEFENILALSYEALPFPVALPSDFARCYDEIGIFEAPFSEFMFDHATSMGMTPQFEPVLSLVFYKQGLASVARVKQAILRQVAEGKLVKKGDLYVLTSVETLSLNAGVVRWRMSKAKVQAMKAAKWCFVAYRFDSDASGIPISSQEWVEVNPMRTKLLA
ncbi:uncharacterized protein ARMOST_03037 [Armillaria ostoyae]|uniref:DUF4470 domain-containing protein n=1 Tax=Armillaria ostoyae TaxID=47428 RepID=A0A284QTC4_ARMOS|nr:uncharacterized protein ARMOST_03037 [Armillaria ostoyae]